MKKALIALAATLCAISTPAVAKDDVATLRVPVADLDLATPAGQRVLDRRLWTAASRLCSQPRFGTLLRDQECIRDVLNRSQPQRAVRIAGANGAAGGGPALAR